MDFFLLLSYKLWIFSKLSPRILRNEKLHISNILWGGRCLYFLNCYGLCFGWCQWKQWQDSVKVTVDNLYLYMKLQGTLFTLQMHHINQPRDRYRPYIGKCCQPHPHPLGTGPTQSSSTYPQSCEAHFATGNRSNRTKNMVTCLIWDKYWNHLERCNFNQNTANLRRIIKKLTNKTTITIVTNFFVY